MKYIYDLRSAIYVTMFAVLAVGSFTNTLKASPTYCDVDNSNPEQEDFWPADMVPHPHIPGSGPKGPNERELS